MTCIFYRDKQPSVH